MDTEKKNIALNVLVKPSMVEKLDKLSQDTMRSKSQVLRLILQKYFELVEQGKIEPMK